MCGRRFQCFRGPQWLLYFSRTDPRFGLASKFGLEVQALGFRVYGLGFRGIVAVAGLLRDPILHSSLLPNVNPQ